MLKDAPRPPESLPEEFPLEAYIYPKAILPKSASPLDIEIKNKLEAKLIKSEINGALVFNQQDLMISQHEAAFDAKKLSLNDNQVVSVAMHEVRDVSSSPMLVISQDALVNQNTENTHEISNNVIEPIIELGDYEHIADKDDEDTVIETGEGELFANFVAEEVKPKLQSKSGRGRPLSSSSTKIQKLVDSSGALEGDVLDDSENNLTGLDLRCGVCGVVLEEDKLDSYCDVTKELETHQADLTPGESLCKILESIIGEIQLLD